LLRQIQSNEIKITAKSATRICLNQRMAKQLFGASRELFLENGIAMEILLN
jgi:hypothetical protein